MRTLIDEMMKTAQARLYYPAILTACTIPDICAALDSDGTTRGSKYIEWFDKYVAPKYLPPGEPMPFLIGNDAYYLRCSLLHQGLSEHNKLQNINKLAFIVHHPNVKIHNALLTNRTLVLDVEKYCQSIHDSVLEWLNEVEGTEIFQLNYKRFFKRHEDGDLRSVYGVPILTTILKPNAEPDPFALKISIITEDDKKLK